jgi:glycosyltransferase involved in cell wall biosynthesis
MSSRNEPCPCGSSKRYKHCCGAASAQGASPKPQKVIDQSHGVAQLNGAGLMHQALALQHEGKLDAAEALYRQALGSIPGNFDALHMLGVIRLQLGDPENGARHILEAIRVAQIDYPPLYGNLGLCLVAIARKRGILRELIDPELPESDRPRIHFARDLADLQGEPPLVSVVMPCYNHERFVAETLRSVFRQTYRNLELVVIDDGSRDASARMISETIRACPFLVRFHERENRGAPHTMNECIRMARGRYVAAINSDDQYGPERIEALTKMLSMSGMKWGFSGVRFIDDRGNQLKLGDNERADSLMRHLGELHEARSITAAFLGFNYSISTGNLFFEKQLWNDLGGFRDYRYMHDWDFCFRACLVGAPSILFEPKYRYRIHDSNTISESKVSSVSEADKLYSDWESEITRHHKEHPAMNKIIALQDVREWRLLEGGRGHLIRPERLVELAKTMLALG